MIARAFHLLMLALALVSAYLQLNDPDPLRWVLMYLGCAAVALVALLGRPSRALSLGVALIAAGWACAIVPELIGRWSPSQLFSSMIPDHPEIEYGREFGGLTIVAVYCLIAFLLAPRPAAPRELAKA